MENWEKQLTQDIEEFVLERYGVVKRIKKIRKDLIKEFTSGQRCMSCGKLKEKDNTLSDLCGKCLEEQ